MGHLGVAAPSFDLVVRRPQRFGIYFFTTPTRAGKAWVRRHVDAPDFSNGFAVDDTTYADDIISGALDAGLTVGWVPRGEADPVAMARRGSSGVSPAPSPQRQGGPGYRLR